jgi:hypothetical protein
MTKRIEYRVGQKIGNWTVVNPECAPGKSNERLLLLKCVCGNQKLVSSSSLRSGASNGCGGCLKIPIDIGYKWGLWTVISETKPSSCRSRRFICQCKCGHERSISASHVKSGQTKSCLRCSRQVKYTVSIGDRFGKLVIISKPRAEMAAGEKRSSRTVTVKCDCGKQKSIKITDLVKTVRSCGCSRMSKKTASIGGVVFTSDELSAATGLSPSVIQGRIAIGSNKILHPKKYS